MSEGINLLVDKKKRRSGQEKLIKIFRIVSVGLLCLTAVSSIALFIIQAQSPIASLRSQERNILNNISQFKTKRAKLITINNRLENVSDILDKRTDFYKTLGILLGKIPSKVIISSLSINSNNLTITMASSSLLAINTTLDNLMNITGEKKFFSKLTLGSINVDTRNAAYLLSIKAEML